MVFLSIAGNGCAGALAASARQTSEKTQSSTFEDVVIGPLGLAVVQSSCDWSEDRFCLALAKHLLAVAAQGRKQVAQDVPRSGPDFHRHRHARRKIDHSS